MIRRIQLLPVSPPARSPLGWSSGSTWLTAGRLRPSWGRPHRFEGRISHVRVARRPVTSTSCHQSFRFLSCGGEIICRRDSCSCHEPCGCTSDIPLAPWLRRLQRHSHSALSPPRWIDPSVESCASYMASHHVGTRTREHGIGWAWRCFARHRASLIGRCDFRRRRRSCAKVGAASAANANRLFISALLLVEAADDVGPLPSD